MKSQFKIGAIMSYLNIILNMAISIFLTPFILGRLGDSEYGVYKIIQSFAGQLSIMSFGVATLIVRYIVVYNTQGKQKEKENFLFFAKLVTYILSVIIALVGVIMYVSIDSVYASSLSVEEIELAKKLMVFLVLNIILVILCDSHTGIMNAHEKFAISKGIQAVRLTLRAGIIIALLLSGTNALGIVIADCVASFVVLVFAMIYGRFVLKEKAKFHYFDKGLLHDSLLFSFAIFLQTIIGQVNSNLDNLILGIMTTPEIVTMYSLGLTIFVTFNTLVTSLGGLFNPQATRLVTKGASGEELTDFIIKPGRFQLMIAGLVICGFVLFGKNFITLWVGEEYTPIYGATILLLVPSILPLISCVSESILNAMLKRLGRSLILIGMSLVNVIVSVICINYFGYIGAAIGTATSFIVGYGILINIYLYKVAKINVIRMFKEIFSKNLFAIIISFCLGIPVALLPGSLLWFIVKVLLFTVIYFAIIYLFGMRKYERQIVKNFFGKSKKSKKESV